MKIVLDTNFFIYTIQYKIFHQLERPDINLLISNQILSELKKLAEWGKKSKDKEAAKIALELIKKLNIGVIEVFSRSADESVLKLALQEKASLATMDEILARKAENKGAKIIRIRQKKFIYPL